MSARILDGKSLAQTVREGVGREVARLTGETGRVPGLAVILVGENAASKVYVRNKRNACRAAGMIGSVINLPTDTTEATLLARIDSLNQDPDVHGILVQLPLPPQIDERRVIEQVHPLKDVDGFHPENAGLLSIGIPRFVPCTPLGVQEMLRATGMETRGARAVVLGRSNIVGKPMALLLIGRGPGADATVTLCHTGTRDVAEEARRADILIAAVGKPELVRGDWVKPGAVVIDVGIHQRPDGSLCGDVAFEEASRVASWITPVPGGVGPMTIAMLLRNTLHAFKLSLP